jgi:hypothetical protein
MKMRTVLHVASIAATMAFVAGTTAEAFSKKVKNACAGDFESFCSQYAPDSPQLRRCFQSNSKQLSRECVSALVDAGEVPSRYRKK